MEDSSAEELMRLGVQIMEAESLLARGPELGSQLAELLGAERAVIYLLHGVPPMLTTRLEDGKDLSLPAERTTFAGAAAERGAPVLGFSPEELRQRYPDSKPTPHVVDCSEVRSLAVFPILLAGQVVGVLEVINPEGSLDREHRLVDKLLDCLASAISAAGEATQPIKPPAPQPLNRARRTLEQILLDEGLMTIGRMQDAIKVAEATKRPVHRVLKSLYNLPERDFARAVAIRYGQRFFEWEAVGALDPASMQEAIPEDTARRTGIVPLGLLQREGQKALRVVVTAGRYMKGDFEIVGSPPVVETFIGARADVAKLMETIYFGGSSGGRQRRLGSILRAIEHEKGSEEDVHSVDVKPGVGEEDSPIINLVHRIIEDAWRNGASDIHLEPRGSVVLVRHRRDGELAKALTFPIHARRAVVTRIKILAGLDITIRNRPQDGKISYREWKPGALQHCPPGQADVDLRVGILPTVGEDREDVVLRILPNAKPTPLSELQMRPAVHHNLIEVIEQPHGLFLATGPTGSGKTTTMHGCLHHINRPEIKILTVEDPVEITHPDFRQVQVNRRINLSFASALRQFLRQDPDVIMVGECRDEETAGITVEAALTGHLVFSTLHTSSASEAVTRLLDMNVEPFTFADALLGVLGQRLVRRLCPDCSEDWTPEPEEWDELGIAPGVEPLRRARGCESCGGSGFRGRLGIHELLVANKPIRKLISSRAPTRHVHEAALQAGMTTLYQDGLAKVLAGLTTVGEIRRVCRVGD